MHKSVLEVYPSKPAFYYISNYTGLLGSKLHKDVSLMGGAGIKTNHFESGAQTDKTEYLTLDIRFTKSRGYWD